MLDGPETLLIPAVVGLSSAVVYLFHKVWFMHRDSEELKDKIIKRLSDKVDNLQYKVLELEKEKAIIKNEFQNYASAQNSAPLPMWLKDINGNIIFCNAAYERKFLIPRGYKISDILGYKEDTVWPESKVEESNRNDCRVLTEATDIDVEENFPTNDDPGRKIRVVKWPRKMLGLDQVFGIAAVAITEKVER